MNQHFSVAFLKKTIICFNKLFFIAYVYLGSKSIVFAMDPNSNPENNFTLIWKYAKNDQTLPELKSLIEKNDLDINLSNEKKQTVLHIAAIHGAESILSYLLKLKNNTEIKSNSAHNNHVNNLKVEIDTQDSNGHTALHLAILNNYPKLAEMLLEAKASLSTKDTLHVAAQKIKDKKFIKLLIHTWKKAQLNIDDSDNFFMKTPLMEALEHNNRPAVEALLEAGAQIDKTDVIGADALKYAIRSEDEAFLQFFIEIHKAKLDIDVQDRNGRTALMHAAGWRNKKAVKELLKAEASVHIRDNNNNYTPLHFSIISVDDPQQHPFIDNEGFFQEFQSTIRLLIEAGANLHAVDNTEKTPLHIAFDMTRKYQRNGAFRMLIELLTWYITYQINTAFAHPGHFAALQSIKNTYLQSQSLRQANPLAEWMFTELVECTSKKQLIEKILQYLETADAEEQRIMIESMEYLLLKENMLEEFSLNFNTFKKRFSSNGIALEKLKNIFRYLYAQKL